MDDRLTSMVFSMLILVAILACILNALGMPLGGW